MRYSMQALCQEGTVCRQRNQCLHRRVATADVSIPDPPIVGLKQGSGAASSASVSFDSCGPAGLDICCPVDDAVANSKDALDGVECDRIDGEGGRFLRPVFAGFYRYSLIRVLLRARAPLPRRRGPDRCRRGERGGRRRWW